MAPEIINQKYTGFKSDFWSLGVAIFILMNGKAPFHGSNFSELFQCIMKNKIDEVEMRGSEKFKEALKGFLRIDPTFRYDSNLFRKTEWFREMS